MIEGKKIILPMGALKLSIKFCKVQAINKDEKECMNNFKKVAGLGRYSSC